MTKIDKIKKEDKIRKEEIKKEEIRKEGIRKEDKNIEKVQEKALDICNSVISISIKKVIIRSLDADVNETKLIFVGPQSSNIKNILNKLEKNITLSKQEQKDLEKQIPFYNKKFGSLQNYNTYFIYTYLEENVSIYHTKIILYQIIKEKIKEITNEKDFYPNNILLYKYMRNIDYKYYIHILNYIFDGEYELSNEDMINKLQKITFKNKGEIYKLIKDEILPGKYKDISEITFLEQEKYYYDDCINNEELLHLFINNPIILSHTYNYINGNKKNTYYGYQNIDVIINAIREENRTTKGKKADGINILNLKDIKFFPEQNISLDITEYPYQNLDNFNKTLNNEYFIITYADMKKYAPQSIIDFYFPNVDSKLEKDKQYNFIYNKFNFAYIQNENIQQDILTVQKCFCRNIIFESLSPNLNTKYEIANLFNNLNTNYYYPVIKYISDGEVKYIKLNKKFLINHSFSEISKLTMNTDVLKGGNRYNLNYKDFIQYKWRISKSEILTINFYDNGYSTIYFDDDKSIPLDEDLFTYLKLVPDTIKQFKKIINAKHLKLPHISSVFNENAEKINYSKLLNGNIILNTIVDIKKIQTADEIKMAKDKLNIPLFISRVRKYFKKLHHFALPKNVLANNSIKLFYKQVNQFYSEKSIANFINASLDEEKQDRKLSDKIINQVMFLFNCTEDKIKKIYENLDNYNLKTGEKKLLYGIEIEMRITNEGLIDIHIENVDRYYNIRIILFYIKTVFSLIARDIENNIMGMYDETASKISDVSKSASASASASISIKKSKI